MSSYLSGMFGFWPELSPALFSGRGADPAPGAVERSAGAAHLHLARTVCRRAEREVIALARAEPMGEFVLPYLNRLSDLPFAMARYENRQRGVDERLWDAKA